MSNNNKDKETLFNLIAILLMFMANASDVLTTIMALEMGGYEANPLGRFILDNFGYNGLWGMKFLYLGAYSFASAKGDVKTRLRNSLIGSAFVFAVVIWNIIMILRLL